MKPHSSLHPRPAPLPPADGTAPVRSVCAALNHSHCAADARRAERAVALVITLILLSVITFMTVAFLVLSRNERGSVSGATEQAVARLATDNALASAEAQILGPMLAFNNVGAYDLAVSTNFITRGGFFSGLSSPTNVGYTYANGAPLSPADSLQNLNNLQILPRPPVYIVTNRNQSLWRDFRYYIDLNRNGMFDPSGNMPYLVNGLSVGTNFFVGDPQWIGVLEFPERRHSATNRFVARYAYLVVPSGKTLDINTVHNYAKQLAPNMALATGDGFLRNQGVGTWEINLGAFLTDLNTNQWNAAPNDYNYQWLNLGVANGGFGFQDALSILRYRYQQNYRWLRSVSGPTAMFDARGAYAFANDYYDGYSKGPVMTNTWWPNARTMPDYDVARLNFPWSGADNPEHLFTTQEWFDRSKVAPPAVGPGFADRLWAAGMDTNSSYNRYTYYRLLSQLGSDSAPEAPGKMNINYDNLVQSNSQGVVSSTNFIPWRPIDFFVNAANRLLENAGYNFTVTNIPLSPTNFYTPNVHRLLQLAANLYDATTNQTIAGLRTAGPQPPTIFQPTFRSEPITTGGPGRSNQVYISGYREVGDLSILNLGTAGWHDLNDPKPRAFRDGEMVYGVPLIVGAKKGFPNFNEFEMQTALKVTRKLEFRRPDGDPTGKVNETNEMYTLSVSNVFGLEAWNSYSNAYPRDLDMYAVVEMFAVVTNETGFLFRTNLTYTIQPGPRRIAAGSWTGFNTRYAGNVGRSMQIPFHPITNGMMFLTNSTYSEQAHALVRLTGTFERHPGTGRFEVPQWWLNLRTRMRFALVDREANRFVDYVNLDTTEKPIFITDMLMRGDPNVPNPYCRLQNNKDEQHFWCTNREVAGNLASPTYGVFTQIAASAGHLGLDDREWTTARTESSIAGFQSPSAAATRFNERLNNTITDTNVFYSPYNPIRTVYFSTSWQANDPLVHYTPPDLANLADNKRIAFKEVESTANATPPLGNIGDLNDRYEPWYCTYSSKANQNGITFKNRAFKDPMVQKSDDWDFPTNKMPNVGWLGRVHRGTPWQTVYLKSESPDATGWTNWLHNERAVTNYAKGFFNNHALRDGSKWRKDWTGTNLWAYDWEFTHPTNDWAIMDLFTTALNANASRGRLSINQTNLAAWSAVLSGVNVMSNSMSSDVIQPAGNYSPLAPPALARIVAGINAQRARMTNNGSVFRQLGDILSVPELTVRSPYVNTNVLASSDAVYERIPQQILGLLQCDGPRFVVYSFGQALKPAEKSIFTGGGANFGLCTNYQITAEAATRAVLRVEGAPDNTHIVVESFNVLPPD